MVKEPKFSKTKEEKGKYKRLQIEEQEMLQIEIEKEIKERIKEREELENFYLSLPEDQKQKVNALIEKEFLLLACQALWDKIKYKILEDFKKKYDEAKYEVLREILENPNLLKESEDQDHLSETKNTT